MGACQLSIVVVLAMVMTIRLGWYLGGHFACFFALLYLSGHFARVFSVTLANKLQGEVSRIPLWF